MQVLRMLIGAFALLSLYGAAGFLLRPDRSAASLGVTASNAVGRGTIRADFTALFAVIGVFALAAAWRGDGSLLAAPCLAAGLALCGRIVSFSQTGGGAAELQPMAVEAAALAAFVLGYWLLPGAMG